MSCCSSSSSPIYFLAPVSRNMIGRGSVLKEAPPEQTVDTDCRMKATGLLHWRWPLTSCEKILQSKIGAELVELSICFPVRLWVTFVSGRLRKLTSDILHSDISSSYILCNLQQAVGLPLGPLSNISGKPVKGGMSGASLCVCVCVCVCVCAVGASIIRWAHGHTIHPVTVRRGLWLTSSDDSTGSPI